MNIHWLDQPYKATNRADGFEILVHGFWAGVRRAGNLEELFALCISEEGVLHTVPINDGAITLDWRYKRGRGWFSIDELEADKPND